VGEDALMTNSSGQRNVSVGSDSLRSATTGHYNIAIGAYAGDNITSGSNNVVIGKADVASATGSDQLSISSGDGSPVWITGDSAGKVTMNSVSPAAFNTWAQFFYQRDSVGTNAYDLRLPSASGATSTQAGYPMPADGVIKAVSIASSGTALSGTATQTFRLRINGATSGADIEEFTLTADTMTNPNGNNFTFTKTGLSLALSAGDSLQISRSAGSLSFGHLNAMVYVDFS
jgi:hypothetical protein